MQCLTVTHTGTSFLKIVPKKRNRRREKKGVDRYKPKKKKKANMTMIMHFVLSLPLPFPHDKLPLGKDHTSQVEIKYKSVIYYYCYHPISWEVDIRGKYIY